MLGKLSRNVLMTLSLACVTGSVIWVSWVGTAEACYEHGKSRGYGPRRPGEPCERAVLLPNVPFLSANQNNSWKTAQYHD